MIKNTRGPLTALMIGVAALAVSVSVPVGRPLRTVRKAVPSHEKRGERPADEGTIRVAERLSRAG